MSFAHYVVGHYEELEPFRLLLEAKGFTPIQGFVPGHRGMNDHAIEGFLDSRVRIVCAIGLIVFGRDPAEAAKCLDRLVAGGVRVLAFRERIDTASSSPEQIADALVQVPWLRRAA